MDDGALAYTPAVSSGNGTATVVYSLGGTVANGAECTISASASNSAFDLFGNRAAAFSGSPVTNDSEQ